MNNTKIKTFKDKTRVIYSMKIAAELIRMGHKVIMTMPNIKDNRYTVWVFEVNDTFKADFEALKGGCRNER